MAVATVTSVNVRQAVPFFGVTNMESSLRFYVDGLGFKMVATNPRKSQGTKIRTSHLESPGLPTRRRKSPPLRNTLSSVACFFTKA